MKTLIDALENRDIGQLRDISAEWQIQRFKEMDKPELVNEIEMKIREPNFPGQVRYKLSADMIYLLDVLLTQEDNSLSLDKLEEEFLQIGTKSDFQEVYNDLFSLGIIYQTGVQLPSGKVYIPKEISLWLDNMISEQITAMEE